MEKYRGFEIRTPDHNTRNKSGFVIFKDGSQYSILHFASFGAAKRVIDRHLASPLNVKEEFSKPVQEPGNLDTVGKKVEDWTVGHYTNKGYLNLIK